MSVPVGPTQTLARAWRARCTAAAKAARSSGDTKLVVAVVVLLWLACCCCSKTWDMACRLCVAIWTRAASADVACCGGWDAAAGVSDDVVVATVAVLRLRWPQRPSAAAIRCTFAFAGRSIPRADYYWMVLLLFLDVAAPLESFGHKRRALGLSFCRKRTTYHHCRVLSKHSSASGSSCSQSDWSHRRRVLYHARTIGWCDFPIPGVRNWTTATRMA